MANNITILNATGDSKSVATREVDGVHHPKNLLAFGESPQEVSTDNPLPVQAASLPLPTGAATQATVEAIRVLLTGAATEAKLEAIRLLLAGTMVISGSVISAAAASEAHVGAAGGHTVVVSGIVIRPNDSNDYTINDALSDSTSAPTVLTIAGCARVNAGSGVITRISMSSSGNHATKPQFRLFIFDTAPAAINDNAAFTITDAEMLTVLPGGVVDFTTWTAGNDTANTGNCVSHSDPLNIPFKCGAASTSLFFLIKLLNAYDPYAQEVISVRLGIQQD